MSGVFTPLGNVVHQSSIFCHTELFKLIFSCDFLESLDDSVLKKHFGLL